jgi:hypothetical protein
MTKSFIAADLWGDNAASEDYYTPLREDRRIPRQGRLRSAVRRGKSSDKAGLAQTSSPPFQVSQESVNGTENCRVPDYQERTD